MPELKSQAKWEAGSQRPEVSTPTPNLRQPTCCSPTWAPTDHTDGAQELSLWEGGSGMFWCHGGQGALSGESLAQNRRLCLAFNLNFRLHVSLCFSHQDRELREGAPAGRVVAGGPA